MKLLVSISPNFNGYVTKGTTDGAARPGAEHNQLATLVLTINLQGMVLIPHIILANKSPNVVAPTEFADKPLMWRATVKGYIDSEYRKEYADRLRQAVGHDRRILLIMDGHKAQLTVEVLGEFSRLNIRVYVIPGYTSHGLAPCDQFNFMVHHRRAIHEHEFFHQGLIYNNANLRLIALGHDAMDLLQL